MQQSEWGKALYSRTLISNIGQSLYKVRPQQQDSSAVASAELASRKEKQKPIREAEACMLAKLPCSMVQDL
jgi:hypothetical protein